MKITVFYTSDANKSTDLEVSPTDSVKSVKQKIIALYKPPDWANTAILTHKGDKNQLQNKAKVNECFIQEGTILQFAYARNLTVWEKLELSLDGSIQPEPFEVPAFTVSTLPKEKKSC
mmetsp:Transcript_31722/g.67483  ORF Transcript_31722/g.67483 Transcript_31722/m.67483 type:complete len:118 (-) Transcript_31722:118-471(-)